MPDDPLLTTTQLAQRTDMTERQIRYLISNCGLPAYRASGLRVRWSEFEQWIETRRIGGEK